MRITFRYHLAGRLFACLLTVLAVLAVEGIGRPAWWQTPWRWRHA